MVNDVEFKKLSANQNIRKVLSAYIFMTLAILILGMFLILLIIFSIFLAFHKVKFLGELKFKWIGRQNFICLANDERVWITLKNTADYVTIVVPI